MKMFLIVLPLLAGCTIESGMARIIGVSTIGPGAARKMLETRHPTVLDVRDREAFEAGHLPGAILLSLDQLDGYLARFKPPRERPVLAVCYRGHASQVAAAVARAQGYPEVYSLAGGVERWRALGLPVERGTPPPLDAARLRPPVIEGSQLLQALVSVAGLGLKPLYMLLSLLIVLGLRGRKERDLTLIRQGMAAFLVGEGICALNFLSSAGTSETLELLHGVGMVVMGALLPWGLFRLLDERVLRLSDPGARCTVQRLCGSCWKREAVSCGAHRMFQLVAPALALVALIPLCTPLRPLNVVQPIFGSDVTWSDSVTVLLVEQRLYPVLAAFHFLLATWKLRGGKASMTGAQGPFFWGLGFLSFALMRFFLNEAYHAEPGWADWWEESTELLTVAAAGLLLWVFRRQLGLGRRSAAAGEGGDGPR